MYHLTLCLLFVLGVDAIVPHSHYTHVSRRFRGDPQTLDVFPRSSHGMNPADPLVDPKSGFSEHVHARQLKRQVVDRDWAHTSSAATSPNVPERDVNYLSNTGPVPAGQPAKHVPVTDSSAEAAPASTSIPTGSPANRLSAPPPRQTTKTSMCNCL